MKGIYFFVAFFFCAMTAFAQETSGRTDMFYDSDRNVIFATASSNPDYNTQYYYTEPVTTYLTKMDLTQLIGWWGWNEGEFGPGSAYVETPAEAGAEFTALTYYQGVVRYMTYEVVPGCYDCCYDWYDAYGYLSIARTGDPTMEGPTFSVWVWAAPIIVARIIEEVFDLGESGPKLRAPGEAIDFDVAVRSFIPAAWVDSPNTPSGCTGDFIFNGNNRTFERFTWAVKTHSSVILLPDQGSFVSTSIYHYPGPTREYHKATGLAADGVTLLNDNVLNDCYKLNRVDTTKTDNMHIDVYGDAS